MKIFVLVLLYLTTAFATGLPCTYRNRTIASGGMISVWDDDPPCLQTMGCTGAYGAVFCNNGVLSGNTDFVYFSCSEPITCGCTAFDETALNNKDTYTVYSAATSCSDCDAIKGEVYCHKNVLEGDTGFRFTSCEVVDCPCEVNSIHS